MPKIGTGDCKRVLAECGSATWKRTHKVKDGRGHTIRAFSDGKWTAVIDSGEGDSEIVAVYLLPMLRIEAADLKDESRPWLPGKSEAPPSPPSPYSRVLRDRLLGEDWEEDDMPHPAPAPPRRSNTIPEDPEDDWDEDWDEDDDVDPDEPPPRTNQDFVFCVVSSSETVGCVAYICSRWYWEQHGHLDDRSLATRYVQPMGFYELSESTYEFDGTPEQARRVLANAGMTSPPDFQRFMESRS